MNDQMLPTHSDVVAGALDLPVRSSIGLDLLVPYQFQWDRRLPLMGTGTALLLFVAVVVSGFGDTPIPNASIIKPTTTFTNTLLAPALNPALHGLRPRILNAHKLNSRCNPVFARKPLLRMTCVEDEFDSEKGRIEWAKQGKNKLTKKYEPEQRDVPAVDAVTMFALMDLDGNGVVSEEEFRTYLSRFSYTPNAASKIFKALDANGDGELCRGEVRELAKYVDGNSNTAFGASMRFGDAQFVKLVHAEADKMFDIIDENGDGEISSKELRSYLMGHGYSEIASEAVLRSLDSNADGKLCRFELQNGFEKYSALRQAVVELVKSLVASRRWMPADYYRADGRPA